MSPADREDDDEAVVVAAAADEKHSSIFQESSVLNGQQSPDFNPLYPECPMENHAVYENYLSSQSDIHSISEQLSPSKRDDENDKSQTDGEAKTEIEEEPDTNESPATEMEEAVTVPKETVEADSAAEADVDETGDDDGKIANTDSDSSQVKRDTEQTHFKPVTVHVTDREILDSDNSEVFLTPTEINDVDKKDSYVAQVVTQQPVKCDDSEETVDSPKSKLADDASSEEVVANGYDYADSDNNAEKEPSNEETSRASTEPDAQTVETESTNEHVETVICSDVAENSVEENVAAAESIPRCPVPESPSRIPATRLPNEDAVVDEPVEKSEQGPQTVEDPVSTYSDRLSPENRNHDRAVVNDDINSDHLSQRKEMEESPSPCVGLNEDDICDGDRCAEYSPSQGATSIDRM